MFLVTFGRILSVAASLYTLVLLARIILDWSRFFAPRWTPKGPVLVVADWVYRLTDPPIRFMRRYVPPLRLGNVALDVGFIVVFVVVAIIGRIGRWLMYMGYFGA